MPKKVNPLTISQIEKATPKTRTYSMGDGAGLYIKIHPSNVKTWMFNYHRPTNGKRAQLSLGTYPNISVIEARALRKTCTDLINENIDPKDYFSFENEQIAKMDNYLNIGQILISELHSIQALNSNLLSFAQHTVIKTKARQIKITNLLTELTTIINDKKWKHR